MTDTEKQQVLGLSTRVWCLKATRNLSLVIFLQLTCCELKRCEGQRDPGFVSSCGDVGM